MFKVLILRLFARPNRVVTKTYDDFAILPRMHGVNISKCMVYGKHVVLYRLLNHESKTLHCITIIMKTTFQRFVLIMDSAAGDVYSMGLYDCEIQSNKAFKHLRKDSCISIYASVLTAVFQTETVEKTVDENERVYRVHISEVRKEHAVEPYTKTGKWRYIEWSTQSSQRGSIYV